MKKYNYEDHFELLYLRHEYLNKCEKLEGKYVKEYAPIVHTTAKIMYNKLYPNFNKVGFQQDDLIAITNMYMLGYMGLYSLRFKKEARDKYIHQYRKRYGRLPTEKEIYAKDKNNMINFLRQRIQHCSTICARKARSIVVGEDRRGIYAETAHSKPAVDEVLLTDYSKLGYRKVTKAEYKEAKEAARKRMEQTVTDKDGFKIRYVEILSKTMSQNDYSLLFNDSTNQFLADPESFCISLEDNMELEKYRNKFTNMEESKKRRTLRRFIEKNRGDKTLKSELALARKMLKTNELVV